MAEDGTQEGTEGTESQEGSEQEGTSGAPQEGTGSGSQEEQGNDELSRARREAAKYRTELRTVQGELKKLTDAGKSDAEKVAAARDEAVAKVGTLEGRVKTLTVQVAAQKLGVVDPEAAAALLDWDDIDDVTDSKQVERALKALVKERPWLAPSGDGRGSGDAGQRGQGGSGGGEDMNALLRQAAGRA